ncbi:MAG: TlpA family protein disulfide reductase [Bacteroidales bacterium]|nr:TlpA family protein disulfide reductase [Bacteroidales bacterium]MCB9013373.1 TlpA family protein disulfide reductase [Bacteroidales bacterium]
MIPKLILFLLVNLSAGMLLFSQGDQVTIRGTDKAYAGKNLDFFIYRERILDTEETLASTRVDSTGYFSLSFNLDQTNCIYCNTPLYKAYIYVVPGKSYTVNLPPLPLSTDENDLNPFFVPPLWHMLPVLKGAERQDLNLAISEFDKQYEPFLDKQILRYYDPAQSGEKLDSFIRANKTIPEIDDKQYFENYRLYKIASLSFLVSQFSNIELFDKFLKNKPAYPDIPSWWDFFKLYYDRYFSTLAGQKGFEDIYVLTGRGQYTALNRLLKTDSALSNDPIREWVMLKEIHNAYYESGLALTTLEGLCDSISSASHNEISVLLSESIRRKASMLVTGNLPPSGLIKNMDGDSLNLANLKGKYTYIGFCSLNNIGCQQEFEYLKYFFFKQGKYLDILVIVPESERKQIESFTDEHSIPWKFWFGVNDQKILNDYNVKAYPVFFLLDREGKLLMSPAPLPSAGFEKQLFGILRGKGEI